MNKTLCMISCLVLSVAAHGGTVYVNAAATGIGDGSAWADAYTSLPAAMTAAASGDELWVAAGTYEPITLKDGVSVIGGFAGTEAAAIDAEPETNKTYISGGGTRRAVESVDNDATAVLRGFYIVEGYADLPDVGGGFYLRNSHAVIAECVFTRNRVATLGGAVANFGGSPTFVNCRFHDNTAGWSGGAVYNRRAGTPSFVNCLFHHNQAMEGGAVTVLTGSPEFVNCTFADNAATVGKGGAFFDTRGESVLHNCIVWNNAAVVPGSDELFNKAIAPGRSRVSYSDVRGGWPGEGNIDGDPLFVGAATRDYRVRAESPCLDRGRNEALPPDVADVGLNGNVSERLSNDLAHRGRVAGAAVDMGAFEAQP